MAEITGITLKVETPTSESDSNYSEFEFMLGWYGRDGSFLTYLFTDWLESQEARVSNINIQEVTKLSNIINNEARPVRLVAEDLSLNDMKVIASIFVAKKIIRIYKDGTTERVGIENNTNRFRQTNGRYNLEFDIIQYELALAK